MTSVRYAVSDAVATITLARPEARNMLDAEALGLLGEHLARPGTDS